MKGDREWMTDRLLEQFLAEISKEICVQTDYGRLTSIHSESAHTLITSLKLGHLRATTTTTTIARFFEFTCRVDGFKTNRSFSRWI